jgi:triosephosphate isomerase
MVCADTPEEAEAIACLHPNIILAEAPEMIGTGKWDNERNNTISAFLDGVRRIDRRIQVLMGAGISTGQDVEDVIRAGAAGVGSSSGIILAEAPGRVLEEMSAAARKAWDAVH